MKLSYILSSVVVGAAAGPVPAPINTPVSDSTLQAGVAFGRPHNVHPVTLSDIGIFFGEIDKPQETTGIEKAFYGSTNVYSSDPDTDDSGSDADPDKAASPNKATTLTTRYIPINDEAPDYEVAQGTGHVQRLCPNGWHCSLTKNNRWVAEANSTDPPTDLPSRLMLRNIWPFGWVLNKTIGDEASHMALATDSDLDNFNIAILPKDSLEPACPVGLFCHFSEEKRWVAESKPTDSLEDVLTDLSENFDLPVDMGLMESTPAAMEVGATGWLDELKKLFHFHLKNPYEKDMNNQKEEPKHEPNEFEEGTRFPKQKFCVLLPKDIMWCRQ